MRRLPPGPDVFDAGTRLVAYPQFGPGSNHAGTGIDLGRESVTGRAGERFHFRAPSLLNVAVTAPYGHVGAFATLEEVIRHYDDPRASVNRLFGAEQAVPYTEANPPFCQLPQILALMAYNEQGCGELYPEAYANSLAVVEHLEKPGEVWCRPGGRCAAARG